MANAAIDTYDDHRMAMCFSLVSFGASVRINDPQCVSKTFPDYFEKFAAIIHADPAQGKFAAPVNSFDIL